MRMPLAAHALSRGRALAIVIRPAYRAHCTNERTLRLICAAPACAAPCVVVCMGNSKSREQVRVAAEGGLISTHVIRQHWCRYVGADTMPRASALPFLEGVAKEADISVPQSELLAIIDSCAQRTARHPLWRAGGDVIPI